jgi:hypothetical protein
MMPAIPSCCLATDAYDTTECDNPSTVGDDAPSIKQYKDIDSYSLEGKEVTSFPFLNKFIGQFISKRPGEL